MGIKSVKVNAVLNFVRSIMSLIFPLISFPYASKILHPEGIGKVNFANQTVSLFSVIAGLGIYTYAMREASKIRENKEKLSQFCSEVFTLNLLSTLFAYFIFFSVIFTVPKYSAYIPLLLISSITMIFSVLGLEWFYSAQEDFLYITIRSILFQIIGLILLFVLVRDENDFLQYCFITVITYVGSNFLNFIHSRKFIKIRIVNPKKILKHFKPVFIFFGIVVASSIYNVLDTNMLGLFSNDTQVGFYTAGTKVIRIAISALASVSVVIVPRLSYMSENSSKSEFGEMFKKSINVIEFLCIPATFGIFILSEPIIYILCGIEFFDSINVSRIISPILFFILTGGAIGDQIFIPLRKDKLNLYPVIAGAFINIILNFILIPKFGAVGAAIGTVFAESTVNIIKLIFARPFIKEYRCFSEEWKYILSSLIMVISIYLFFVVVKNQFIRLIGGLFIGIFVYFAICFLLKTKILLLLNDRIIKHTKNKR